MIFRHKAERTNFPVAIMCCTGKIKSSTAGKMLYKLKITLFQKSRESCAGCDSPSSGERRNRAHRYSTTVPASELDTDGTISLRNRRRQLRQYFSRIHKDRARLPWLRPRRSPVRHVPRERYRRRCWSDHRLPNVCQSMHHRKCGQSISSILHDSIFSKKWFPMKLATARPFY